MKNSLHERGKCYIIFLTKITVFFSVINLFCGFPASAKNLHTHTPLYKKILLELNSTSLASEKISEVIAPPIIISGIIRDEKGEAAYGASIKLKDATIIAGSDILVKGQITDGKGETLPGVSIKIKGTTVGVTSDLDGRYTIDVPENNPVLVFTYIGFVTQEVAVKGRAVIDVVLAADVQSLDEVVVVGYGTQRRKDVTGNISQISGTNIKDVPMQSFDQALSGRAAGVNITIPNGVLGNPPVIRIRGINSISLSSFPLVVIDGVPSWTGDVGGMASNNVLSDLNPTDIESIEILKDASAAAIYGSRAAAGVMLITTKKGKSGKVKVNYDSWFGYTKAYNLIEMLNAEEFTMIKNEALTNAGTPPNGTTRGFYTMTDANGKLVDTRWSDYVFRTGFAHNHNVNISGASDKTQYFFSAGYTNQEGMMVNNDFTRKTGRFTLDHKVNDRITVGGSLNYTNSNNNGLNTGVLNAFSFGNASRLAFRLVPNIGPFNNDGTYNYLVGQESGQGNNKTPLGAHPNVKMILDLNKFSSESDRIMSNTFIGFKLIKGMDFKTVYGIDYLLVENKEFRNALHGDGAGLAGAASNTMARYKRSTWQNILNYNVSIRQNHNLGVLIGTEQQYSKSDGWGADRRIVNDPYYNVFQGAFGSIVPTGNFLGENFLQSYFSRVNYDYKKKYYLSINARRDGYSAFAPGKKFGNFAGASMGWIVSEEDFFKKSALANTLSTFKLRGSYGEVGNNQGIDDFAFYSFFNPRLNGSNAALSFSQAGNRDLSWETSKKTDIGFSFGLLNNRITGEVAYYRNDIDGMVLADPQSPSAGIPGNSILTNIGSMWNKGWEFTLNANVLSGKALTWNTSLNFTTQINKVTALATGNADIMITRSTLESPSIIRVGESIGSFYAVKTGAVNPANGRRIFYYRDGTAVQYDQSSPTTALRWTYLDGTPAPRPANQASDGVVFGPAIPKWFGGFDNTFRYKGFDLNVLAYFSGGNYVYNGTKATLRATQPWNNAKEALTRWQKPGDITNIPRYIFADNISVGGAFVISENIEKGDFVKIRNVALGFSMPNAVFEKIGLSSVRLYIAAQNAFTFTKYSGFDPEISSNGNSNGSPGVDRNSAPMARSLNFGVNVGF
ncbi:SusC/RagA family TonB-linked outer membrane protein [Daejeonella sp.]|uniref:SusC/RagA family TonB-linked outer membrane protein n=1 Tax=Daejeonella sp. TaxID=2805397 RepID=UPI003982F1A2